MLRRLLGVLTTNSPSSTVRVFHDRAGAANVVSTEGQVEFLAPLSFTFDVQASTTQVEINRVDSTAHVSPRITSWSVDAAVEIDAVLQADTKASANYRRLSG